MNGLEQLAAEMACLRRRGRAAAPVRHPLRTAECPPLGALAGGRLSEQQRHHVRACGHCRLVQAAARPTHFAAPAFGAMTAALALAALFLTGWGSPEPMRFAAPTVQASEPAPRAVEAAWPAPRLPRLRALTPPTTPRLPRIQPLERFEPPTQAASPVPLAVLGGPPPPDLAPGPAPDVVGMLGLRLL